MQLHILLCPRHTTTGRLYAARDYYVSAKAEHIDDVDIADVFDGLIHRTSYYYSCGRKVFVPDMYVQSAFDDQDYLMV